MNDSRTVKVKGPGEELDSIEVYSGLIRDAIILVRDVAERMKAEDLGELQVEHVTKDHKLIVRAKR